MRESRVAGVDPAQSHSTSACSTTARWILERGLSSADMGARFPAPLVGGAAWSTPPILTSSRPSQSTALVAPPAEQRREPARADRCWCPRADRRGRWALAGYPPDHPRTDRRGVARSSVSPSDDPSSDHTGVPKWNRIDLGTPDKVASTALRAPAGHAAARTSSSRDTVRRCSTRAAGSARASCGAVEQQTSRSWTATSGVPRADRGACIQWALDAEVAYTLGNCAAEAHRVRRRRARARPRRDGWRCSRRSAAKSALTLTSGPAQDPSSRRHQGLWNCTGAPAGRSSVRRRPRPPRAARRCWLTVWRADAMPGSSSAWAYVQR